jgi:hypothetical protein
VIKSVNCLLTNLNGLFVAQLLIEFEGMIKPTKMKTIIKVLNSFMRLLTDPLQPSRGSLTRKR